MPYVDRYWPNRAFVEGVCHCPAGKASGLPEPYAHHAGSVRNCLGVAVPDDPDGPVVDVTFLRRDGVEHVQLTTEHGRISLGLDEAVERLAQVLTTIDQHRKET